MVKIRLARIGRKFNPTYRIVVSDSRRTPRGASIIQLGSYDPIHDTISMDRELALEWLKKGAIPSDSVKTLLKRENVYQKFIDEKVAASKGKKKKVAKNSKKKLAKIAAKKAKKEEAAKKAAEKPAEPAAEAPKAEEAPAETEAKE